jgi:N6-adenosine-specific RNA methylase IME4
MKEKCYGIVYCDCPWQYDQTGVRGAAELHYPTMNIDELCCLPIKQIAADDCVLFLWATFPKLPEALCVIKAWGFTYKTVGFVWLKQYKKSATWCFGLGFWTRGNVEVCLLATKGHPRRKAKDIHQLIVSPREAHSKKPDEVREKIVALMGDIPRIELFARQTTPGWDVWGNEVKSDIEIDIAKEVS